MPGLKLKVFFARLLWFAASKLFSWGSQIIGQLKKAVKLGLTALVRKCEEMSNDAGEVNRDVATGLLR